jgi:hypothetical protein
MLPKIYLVYRYDESRSMPSTLFQCLQDPCEARICCCDRKLAQMLENTWRETEYRLDILLATRDAHVEVGEHSAVFILREIKLFELHFNIFKQFYFIICGLKIICHGNAYSSLESLYMSVYLCHVISQTVSSTVKSRESRL